MSLARTGGACGVERWTVKTLEDRPRLLPNRLTTVRYLVTRRAPSYLPNTRLPFERRIFTVVARVTFVRVEADSDYHLMLQEGGYHMIAEAPAPYCDARATLHHRRSHGPGQAGGQDLRYGPHHRGRVLRHRPRPGWCRAERDRAAPHPRLPVAQRLVRR
jgi:hypothetical protein